METSPAADRLTSRFIAGHTLEKEIAVCKRLNADGYHASLDHLGESVTSLEEAAASRDAYLAALDQIAAQGLTATVSVKLTQLGLDYSLPECERNVDRLVARAAEIGTTVEIDMEASGYVDRTLMLVSALHTRYRCVRAVLQAYLYRTESDLEQMNRHGIPVRLCKGAYKEHSDVAFPHKRQVDENYLHLMRALFRDGMQPAIASHDPRMLQNAMQNARELKVTPDRFEFQMLYGIRRDLQRDLVRQGYQLRLYVPYGDAWYPYFMRRLAERPANVIFLARNLMKS